MKKMKFPVALLLMAALIYGCAKDEVSPLEKYKLSQSQNNYPSDIVVTQSIGVNGGNISMPGFADIDFPYGSFNTDTKVELIKTENPEIKADFERSMPLFSVEQSNTYFIQVSCDQFPQGDLVEVSLKVSNEVVQSLSAGYGFYLFGLLDQSLDDGETNINFEPINAVYNPASQTLVASVPSYYFTINTDRNSKQKLTLAVGTAPGENLGQGVPTTNDNCAMFIRCPLNECMTSGPNGGFSLARKHPTLGIIRPHLGVDLIATTGTSVYAASDGEVVTVHTQVDPVNGKVKGWGKYIIIQHKNSLGQLFTTLYAHLSEQKVSVGKIVKEGDLIALSGATGDVSGPHLHFEYINSAIVGNFNGRIDPVPFINNTSVRLKAAVGEMTGTNDCEHNSGDPGSGSSWKVVFDFFDPQNSITDGATLTFQDIEPVVNPPYSVPAGSLISQNGLVNSPTFCAKFGSESTTYFKVKVYLTLPNGSESNCIFFNLKRPAGARSDEPGQTVKGPIGSGKPI